MDVGDWRTAQRAGYHSAQVLALGALCVCAGWVFNIDLLTRMLPGLPAIHPLTAICFLLLSITLLTPKTNHAHTAVFFRRYRSHLRHSAIVIVSCLTIAQLVSELFQLSGFFDKWLFPTIGIEDGTNVSKMSAPTIIILVLAIFALLISDTRKLVPQVFVRVATLLMVFIVALSLLGHALHAHHFHGYFIPANTGAFTLLLAFGITTASPGQGWVGMSRYPGLTRALVVWVIPLSLLFPVAIKLIEQGLQHSFSLDQENLLYAESAIVSLIVLISVVMVSQRTYATERASREVSAALQRKQNDLDVTLRSIGEAVIATDNDWNVTRMNRIAEQLSGLMEQQAVGLPISKVIHIFDEKTKRPLNFANRNHIKTQNDIGPLDYCCIRHPDGHEIVLEDTVSRICDDAGNQTGRIIVIRDISLRHQSQLAHAEESWRLQSIIQGTNAGTWSWNVQNGELILDKRWAAMGILW